MSLTGHEAVWHGYIDIMIPPVPQGMISTGYYVKYLKISQACIVYFFSWINVLVSYYNKNMELCQGILLQS